MKNFKKVLSLVLAVLMVVGGLVVMPNEVKAAEQADHVVIHEVYGGGGNSGATFNIKYVVLYNPTATDQILDGWSIQYASYKKTSTYDNLVTLSGTIKAGKYFFVQLNTKSDTNGTDIPAGVTIDCDPDATLTPGASKGRIALVNTSTKLSSTVGGNATEIVDYVAYGAVVASDGTNEASAPAGSAVLSIIRKNAGVDTDNNSEDFTAETPSLSYLIPKTAKDLDPSGLTEQADIVALALELGAGYKFTSEVSLTGTVTNIDTAYASGKVTLTINAGGSSFQCVDLTADTAKLAELEKVVKTDGIKVTGTVKNVDGKLQIADAKMIEWTDNTPDPLVITGTTPAEIVAQLATLKEDQDTATEVTLTGVIQEKDKDGKACKFYTYSESKGTTFVIKVENLYIECYGLKDGKANLVNGTDIVMGDTVTVKGIVTNYKGTIEYYGGSIESYEQTGERTLPEIPENSTPTQIVEGAYQLKPGQKFDKDYTLTGVISDIKLSYKEEHDTIAVWIVVDGKTDYPILCYGLKGNGIDKVNKGDTITVTGKLANLYSTIEFDGCSLDSYVLANPEDISKPKYEKKYETATLIGNFAELIAAGDLKGCNLTGNLADDAKSNAMTYLGNGVYKFTLKFEKTTKDIVLKYKVAFNGTTDNTIGAKSVNTDFAANGGEITITIPAGSTEVTFVVSEKDTVVYDSITNQAKVTEYAEKISKMGDTTNYTLYFMLVLAGAGLVAASVVGKKKMA